MGGTDEAYEALREGLALARTAWRDAWAPLAVCTAGWTAVFVAARAGLPPDSATALGWTGLALVLLMTPSKLGALHRLAAREEAPAPPGPAGLQLAAVEARLTATTVALCALVLLTLAASVAIWATVLTALRPPSRVEADGIGPLSVGFLLTLPVLLAAAVGGLQATGRLAVTLAADACEPGPRFARGWLLTRGAGVAPGLVLAATLLAPLAGLLALAVALDGVRRALPPGPATAIEPLAAGAALAALTQFGLAPLNAGALAHLRRRGVARGRATQAAVDMPGALGDKAPPAGPAAAAPPEILPRMTAFPLVDVALEGVRLTRERPGTVLAWGVVLAAAQAVTTALLAVSGAGEGLAAFTRLGATPGADPTAAAALLPAAAPGLLLTFAVGLLAQTAVYAALLRAVLRPADRRFAFLRVGLDELRLLGVLAALTGLAVVTLFVLVTALSMLILPLASMGGHALASAMPLVMALAVAALSYPVVRLSLAPAASVAEGRARLFGAWPLTSGVFWPLMGSAVMAAVLATVVAVLGEVLVTSLWALGAGDTMAGAAAALQPDTRTAAGALTPGAVGGVVTGGVITAFALTAAAAPGAAAYRVLARRTA